MSVYMTCAPLGVRGVSDSLELWVPGTNLVSSAEEPALLTT